MRCRGIVAPAGLAGDDAKLGCSVRAPPLQVREAAAPVSASFTLLAFRAVPAGGGS